MKRSMMAWLLAALAGTAATARAEERRDATPGTVLAIGTGLSWHERADFGTGARASFVPELIAHHYRPATGRLYLRPGLRLGFAGLEQAEMPRAVRIRERDLGARAELGLLHDGVVIPSISLGVGATLRFLSLSTTEPLMVDHDPVSRTELLPELYGRIGLGLPLARGALVLEPYLGYTLVRGDDRASWLFGLDATVAVF
jgi:hypothetical protein